MAEDRDTTDTIIAFLETVHPYDSLPREELSRVAELFQPLDCAAGEAIYAFGETLAGLYLIRKGRIEIHDRNGALVSLLGPRNSFGERGLLRDGKAATSARVAEDARLLMLPAADLHRLIGEQPAFARFFERLRPPEPRSGDLATLKVSQLMTRDPVTCTPDTPVVAAAKLMRDRGISSICVAENGTLAGILTTGDLAGRVVAEGLSAQIPVAQVMTRDPLTLTPDQLGSDILHRMLERRIGHFPVIARGKLAGIVTQTDLTRFQAVSSAQLVRDAARAESVDALKKVTARIPQLLKQLVGAHNAHDVVTRLITDIADTATRRLLAMAEAELGPPPVPYLWLACGSQGRQEQTGVSDQDNCLFLDDSVTDAQMPYFEKLARFVCDGLDAIGYVYCPGEMMAVTPRWCQPVRVWRDYFRRWIDSPTPEAQMLASVMFDLRPIGGNHALFANLQEETLAKARRNSIFVAHMIANSLGHSPPLGLLRGIATIRSGEHRDHIDMKLSGVIPVVDLGRVYALQAGAPAINTRARLIAAGERGVVSESGARELLAAYDLIAGMRLRNQAAQVGSGHKPDNYMAPASLTDFERSHLRDAFVVVRTMQSAIGQGKGGLV